MSPGLRVIVYPPDAQGGRRVRVDGEILGRALSPGDLLEFVRRAGLDPDEVHLEDATDRVARRLLELQAPDAPPVGKPGTDTAISVSGDPWSFAYASRRAASHGVCSESNTSANGTKWSTSRRAASVTTTSSYALRHTPPVSLLPAAT